MILCIYSELEPEWFDPLPLREREREVALPDFLECLLPRELPEAADPLRLRLL